MKELKSYLYKFSLLLLLLSAWYAWQDYSFAQSSKQVKGNLSKQIRNVRHSTTVNQTTGVSTATSTISYKSFVNYIVEGNNYEMITYSLDHRPEGSTKDIALLYNVNDPNEVRLDVEVFIEDFIVPLVGVLAMWMLYGQFVLFRKMLGFGSRK